MLLGDLIQIGSEDSFAVQVWALLWECCQECPVLVCHTNTNQKKPRAFSSTRCQNGNETAPQWCQYKPALYLRSPVNYLKCLANITLPEQDQNPGVKEVLALLNRTILKEMCERLLPYPGAKK